MELTGPACHDRKAQMNSVAFEYLVVIGKVLHVQHMKCFCDNKAGYDVRGEKLYQKDLDQSEGHPRSRFVN